MSKKTEYHVGSSKSDLSSKPLNIPPPTQPVVKASNSWESPSVDDYNVFSIYSRRQQERKAHSLGSLRPRSPSPEGPGPVEPLRTLSSSERTKEFVFEGVTPGPRFTADTEEDEETLHEESYTQSFESSKPAVFAFTKSVLTIQSMAFMDLKVKAK
ncbi:hypothetical protein DPMN_148877 [Dreissena polymorpha]|uniref:Uncharacterized protein n=1 Tax=Dreissena polymorpha TaxID=45954 RepID=A0A9D4FBQ5_DREPO|nr:hypothetical protein DPMN_148877 [Dreissena polymorpha]